MKITKDDIISEVLEQYPETMKVFRKLGMHCLGCSIERAVEEHDVDLNEMLVALNSAIED